jgi:DNA transposition AAA+ family ATPase
MPLSKQQRRELPLMTQARRSEIVQLMNDYIARTGLDLLAFSRRIGYARASLRVLAAGSYPGDSSAICAAIWDYIKTHPIQPEPGPEGKLYDTENTRLVRRVFYDALDKRRAYYFRGAPGSQKTFTLQHLIAELKHAETNGGSRRRAFYVRCRAGIRPLDLMMRVAESACSITVGRIDRILRNLREELRDTTSLFVFDEAQHLDMDCLETVRELHDMPPHSGMIFAGSHEIEKMFSRLDMEQWASRLRQGTELPGVSKEEAEQIIRAELGEKANVNYVIQKSYATDSRKGREVKYISARTLFWSIQMIQERKSSSSPGEMGAV